LPLSDTENFKTAPYKGLYEIVFTQPYIKTVPSIHNLV